MPTRPEKFRPPKPANPLPSAMPPRPRLSPSKRGYDTDWKRLRLWFLRRNPLCLHCKEQGELTPATEVDHIKPINDGGDRLDHMNLQALCKSCHSRKTVQDVAKRGQSGQSELGT